MTPPTLTDSVLDNIRADATFTAERVGAPGSPIRDRARATVALVDGYREMRAENERLRTPAPGCRCGSGAHPRMCDVHPTAYQEHIDELNADGVVDVLEENDVLTARLAALQAKCVEVANELDKLRDTTNVVSHQRGDTSAVNHAMSEMLTVARSLREASGVKP